MFEKNSLRSSARVSKRQYSLSTLKIIGCIILTLGTIGVAIFQNGILKVDVYTYDELLNALKSDSEVMKNATIAILLYLVSFMAVPIFAKITLEGYYHTSSLTKYIFRVFLLAVITEIPYDMAMREKYFDFDSQNPIFAVAITLFGIYLMENFGQKVSKFKGILLKLFIVLITVFWILVFRTNDGLVFFLVTMIMFLMEGQGAFATALGVMVSMINFPAPLGFIFNHFYSGEKGKISKWLFYIYVPLQYFVLGIISTKL